MSTKTAITPKHTVSKHSVIFNEPSVMLADKLTQSLLKKITQTLQQFIIDKQTTDRQLSAQQPIAAAQMVLNSLYQTPVTDAAVLMAITNEQAPRLLLTKRASNLNAHAGEVSFPGGKHDASDGNNVVTALREACEETGLPPSKVHIVGQLPVQKSRSGLSVRPIVALIDPDVILVPELGEIERIFWADFTLLLDQALEEYAVPYKMQGKSITILTPSWRIENEVLWGLTGRVTASLLEQCFDKHIPWYYHVQE